MCSVPAIKGFGKNFSCLSMYIYPQRSSLCKEIRSFFHPKQLNLKETTWHPFCLFVCLFGAQLSMPEHGLRIPSTPKGCAWVAWVAQRHARMRGWPAKCFCEISLGMCSLLQYSMEKNYYLSKTFQYTNFMFMSKFYLGSTWKVMILRAGT